MKSKEEIEEKLKEIRYWKYKALEEGKLAISECGMVVALEWVLDND